MVSEFDQLLNVQQTALQLWELRQSLLASNVANADTPNYKARDIPFSQVLKQATQTSQSLPTSNLPVRLVSTTAAHLPGKSSNTPGNGVPVLYRNDQQGRIDGNNVNVDYERMQFADNAMRYEASVTLVNARIQAMLTVIKA